MNLSSLRSSAMTAQERRLLRANARRLVHRLSELSQQSMAARWLDDLEFMVWQDMMDRRLVADLLVSPDGDVFPPLDEMEKEELRQLSEAIGGWVVYDPQDAEDRAAFVPLADWIPRFECWFDRARIAVSQQS